MDQYYYVFGFLLLVFLILAVTCAEITIVLCYFQVISVCCAVRDTPLRSLCVWLWLRAAGLCRGFLNFCSHFLEFTYTIPPLQNVRQLCAEDYRWWWRSFMTSGSTALYVFLYSIVYFSRLESNMFVTYLLYFGYMAVISLGVFLVTGELLYMLLCTFIAVLCK